MYLHNAAISQAHDGIHWAKQYFAQYFLKMFIHFHVELAVSYF